MRAVREEEGPSGAPQWIVTFTDMISLLVTFFVLLMTYSSLNPRAFIKVASLLDSQSGSLSSDEGDVAPDLSEDDMVATQNLLRGGQVPHSRPPEFLEERLEQMGQEDSPDHRAVALAEVRDGLLLKFDRACSFEPGSAQVNAELRRSLEEIGDVLRFYSFLIVVEGFADGHFRPTPAYRSADLLSLHRARNAARVLLDECGLAPELVQVAGLGAAQPRANDVTAEGRRMNRRVQLRLLALSTTRSDLLDVRRGAEREGR